ncbi:hypothetical protein ASPZODRAFT_148071 [Penicilliopsis zonata CBS 506.65]|uniref:Ribosome quality control complex subunit 2 n=1 Tax=Penicilliopsis zonata CBS 506.65 TaxID=1073090 RepID=A0A1L9STP7_9EURO|nr:hypothetical protein ASPZODRAFT_148071 [Penicilliopsis zonata CBS 506.65]OJJ50580.1 hypothetical protein ASPZODRAFT_148071 [Penicilliopsis zonata CBS 506.65]
MKQRFSSLDVKVISRELNAALSNLRVSNIYDLSSRIFLFKLAKPDHRRQLIIDSGFRCHVTDYARTTAARPTPFVSKLRDCLKTRRITSVSQIGTDRIIDFSFSEGTYHLFLEFFAGGNIILTDREYNILVLFRHVPADGEQEEVKVGLKYNVANKQNYSGVPEITTARVVDTLEKARVLFAQEGAAPKKSKKKNADVLRKALSHGFPEYPPLLLDHAFAVREMDPATPLEQVLQDQDLLARVLDVLKEAEAVVHRLDQGDALPGYIVAKEDARPPEDEETTTTATATDGAAEQPKKPSLLYEDFHPFKPRQFEGRPGTTILEFERFNATVDEYFSSLETQKLESRLTEREQHAKKKLASVRQEHEKRIGALKEVQELHIRKAGAIEANVFRIQEAMDAVNSLIAQGMDWVEIARLVEMEQGRGNPVAQIIKLPLKLYENTVTLVLGEASDEQDEEDETYSSDSESDEEFDDRKRGAEKESSLLNVDIDLGLSPWANATQYYEQKKTAAVKEQRTIQSSTKALKSHEKKVTDDLKRTLKQEKQLLRPARKPFWFEKFLFFISSEGYLVLGGRDAMQIEIVYRRYLKKGDVFIHADIQGATPMIVKNRPGTPDAPIPPSTLSQAGNFCVSTSTAWDSKALMAAWWVKAEQVSKAAAMGGGIMPVGEFTIKGAKNFLAPSQLVLGFAVMFQISQESASHHHGAQRFGELATDDSKPEEEAETEELDATEAIEEKEDSAGSDSDDDAGVEKNPLQGVSEASTAQAETAPVPQVDDMHDEKDEEEEETGQDNTPDDDEPQSEMAVAEDEGMGDGTEAGDSVTSSQPTGKRHLSARERRLMRKGKPIESAVPETPAAAKAAPPKTTAELPSKASPAAPPPPADTPKHNALPTRGKKGKAKKGSTKYADQDDEERELALRLVGAKSAKAEKAAAAVATKANQEREREAQKQRRRAQHERAAEAEKKRQALFENGAAADDYDEETAAAEAADLAWLPALIGTPRPEDEILAAIPVCAPWAALGRSKYRVKLQPGAVKKGKAVKEIIGRWVAETTTGKVKKEHAEDAGLDRATAEALRAREGELLKGWREAECINLVPVGKVRIMIAGGAGGDSKGKGKGNPKAAKGKKKLLVSTARRLAGCRQRCVVRTATTMTSPTPSTRILSVQRLSEGPGTQSLAEWWASERKKETDEAKALETAARLLRESDIPVAFPTETVYGLGADATRSAAVQGIYRAKQRPSDNPLIVHVDSLDMLDRLLNPGTPHQRDLVGNNGDSGSCRTRLSRNAIPAIYEPLIARFWPGPLTILLPNPTGSMLAPEVTSSLTTFGVRMPASPLARLLIHAADRPLAAPSANASTKPSPTTAQHVLHDLKGRIELILDGGPCGVGVESTVVDGLSDPPAVLRPGGIGIEEIRLCPGWENVQAGYRDGSLDVKEVPRAPGMKYRHYSPKARVVLFEPDSAPSAVARRIRRDLQDTAVGEHKIGIIRTSHWPQGLGLQNTSDGPQPLTPVTSAAVDGMVRFALSVHELCHPTNTTKVIYDCPLGTEMDTIARNLFSALRGMDAEDVDVIYVEGVSAQDGELAAAVINRLRKAAGTAIKAL